MPTGLFGRCSAHDILAAQPYVLFLLIDTGSQRSESPRSGDRVCGVQDKLYAYVSLGGRHQNTSLNTTDTQSPSWSDTLTFEHPTSEHTDISVAVYAKHTLLPDTLVGSAGKIESTCFGSR